jgi:hypothetical protein
MAPYLVHSRHLQNLDELLMQPALLGVASLFSQGEEQTQQNRNELLSHKQLWTPARRRR